MTDLNEEACPRCPLCGSEMDGVKERHGGCVPVLILIGLLIIITGLWAVGMVFTNPPLLTHCAFLLVFLVGVIAFGQICRLYRSVRSRIVIVCPGCGYYTPQYDDYKPDEEVYPS